ncbi:OmpA family protein [Sulfurimonas aquatica]|uniref:OmpA family protein n=1 Tax=Sulfurimonas aquatica TaxID=2672570 RepID=A0A975GCX9_9BACT|nr:OmpA family protein [Sulfurimonas aquatica]QSZ42095.1 OmpA family protein [Sulfurimonas aquatica]
MKIFFYYFILFFGLSLSADFKYNLDDEYYPYTDVVKRESPKTIIVLAEGEKKDSSITVKNSMSSVVVDKANQVVNILSAKKAPTQPRDISKEEFEKIFTQLSKHIYAKSLKYLIYFKINSSTLESNEKINEIVEYSKNKKDLYIKIIGHSDTKGSLEYKESISRQRAENISKLLIKAGLVYENLSVEWYGDANLAVQTDPGVYEELNRRVEILIR